MIANILQLIMIIVVPLIILKYQKFVLTKWFGTIGTAYLFGILISVFSFIFKDNTFSLSLNTDMGEIVSHIAITLAIPLLLFGANIKEVSKLSKTMMVSFISLIVSVIIVSSLVNYLFANQYAHGSIISAMAVGMYTGGTPNFNAIAKMLFLDNSSIALANLSDMVIGGIYYLFLLTLAKPILSLVLKKSKYHLSKIDKVEISNVDDYDTEGFKFSKGLINSILISFLGVLISGILGFGLWIILGMEDGRMNDYLVPVMLIGVTIYGIIISLKSKLHEVKHTNVVGQYMILVFSFSLASSIDFTKIGTVIFPTLIILTSITVGVTLLHILINFFFKIDADATIVTLTAGIYGPAFIPAITKQIKNEDLTVPGLIVGSVGYAIGTFLGYILGLIYLL
ncbi:MAG: DUF819 family protein [Acholeplasmataceae bacterium]